MKKHVVVLEGRGDICARSSTRHPFMEPDEASDVEAQFEAELMAALLDTEVETKEEALAS